MTIRMLLKSWATASGQVADGFELLGLTQLGLETPAILGFGLERPVGRGERLFEARRWPAACAAGPARGMRGRYA
jgi:hypothetical protein